MSLQNEVERDELINRKIALWKDRINGDTVTKAEEEGMRLVLESQYEMEDRIAEGQILSMFTPKQRKWLASAVGAGIALVGSLFFSGQIPGS